MAEKENQRVRLTKLMFRDALLELIGDRDINSITVKELCEKAGLNRTTFYLHYGEPADILAEIERDFIGRTKKYLSPGGSGSGRDIEKLLIYVRDNKNIMKPLLGEYGRDEFRRYFFESVFPEGIFQSAEKSVDPARDKYVDAFMISGVFSAVYTWLLDGCAMPSGELAALIVLMTGGVAQKYAG